MVKIISISLDKETIDKIDFLSDRLKIKSRSEIIRKGVDSFFSEVSELSKLGKSVNATISIVHEHSVSITKVLHSFREVIISHQHNHFSNGKCLETLIVQGNSNDIKDLYSNLKKLKKIEKVKLVVC